VYSDAWRMYDARGSFDCGFDSNAPGAGPFGFYEGLMFSVRVALAIVGFFGGLPAVAAPQYGHVEFANSGAPTAQADLLDGLALLHDFEYDSAAAAFRRSESADPDFAMAYWGEAMTFNHPVWMQQDLKSARAALNRLARSSAMRRSKAQTDREKAYLDAIEILYGEGTKEDRDIRYEDAMAKLHARYPEDVDAAAFYALSILGSAHGGRDVATYMRSAAVLEEAWISHREHPGVVHYLIHSYDDPLHAPLGLRAARLYAKIAPDAAHAQHMTSHIFLALGMWTATVDANVAAIAAVNRRSLAAGQKPYGCGHYPSWLGYAYLQLGDVESARSSLAACRAAMEAALPMGHAAHSMDPDDSVTGSFANMRLRYLLETGDWSGEVASWTMPANAGPGARLDFAFARALGEIAQRHIAAARDAIVELETLSNSVVVLETKRSDPDPTNRVRPEILLAEANGLMAEQENHLAGAEKLLRQAVALEATLPIAFGPPTIDQPTHELLGAFLLRHGQPTEARAEFEKALAAAPGRRLAEKGLQAASAGSERHGKL
jgi:tetratricopeptide (TPR) repeat protein